MSCGCRENMNFFKRPSILFKKFTWKYSRKYLLGDSFGPIACHFFGHDPYVVEGCDNKVACKRCHRFIKS